MDFLPSSGHGWLTSFGAARCSTRQIRLIAVASMAMSVTAVITIISTVTMAFIAATVIPTMVTLTPVLIRRTVVAAIVVMRCAMSWLWPTMRPMPVRRRLAQEIHLLTTGVVMRAMPAPVLGMTGRHPHVLRPALRHHGARRHSQHGLGIHHRRRRGITDVNAPINTGSQLARNRTADIVLCLSQGGNAHQAQSRDGAK